jgi:hydrogenase/urease accessory protein HupE
MIRFLFSLMLFVLIPTWSYAHEVRPALLNITEVADHQYLVQWKVPAMGNLRMAIDPVFESSCAAPPDAMESMGAGASVRSWKMDCGTDLAGTEIGFRNLSTTMIDVFVQIQFSDGRSFTGLVRAADPVYRVPDRDSEAEVFSSFFVLGVEHILLGWDHLAFVLGLLLLVTAGRRLFWAITGFTVAHSITLALAALEIIHVSGPPVEAAIALSIVMLGVEAVRYQRSGVETLTIRAPWLVSLAIGLIHGLGFAGALRDFGLPAHATFVSLFAFNVGVEAGQLAFVGSVIALGFLMNALSPRSLYGARIAATWFVGVCGSFWLIQRVTGFFV